MSRWYLDTEFDEDGRTIELISIALVSHTGLGYYAVSSEFDPEHCNDWVKEHVLPHLGHSELPFLKPKPRAEIASDIKALLLGRYRDGDKPEFWGYYADYDWVVFCQLFGRMVDLPDGMPMYCNDIRQLMHEHGIDKQELPVQTGVEHNALEDARWNLAAHVAIESLIRRKPR